VNQSSTGNNTQGMVAFRGNWAQATDLSQSNNQGLKLVKRVAATS
jgi:hypothetical protein